MPTDLTPIDALDERILNLCTRINAATYELLVMIREFDERGVASSGASTARRSGLPGAATCRWPQHVRKFGLHKQ